MKLEVTSVNLMKRGYFVITSTNEISKKNESDWQQSGNIDSATAIFIVNF